MSQSPVTQPAGTVAQLAPVPATPLYGARRMAAALHKLTASLDPYSRRV